MIRNAKQEDVSAMVAIGKVMHAESTFSKYDFNEQKLSEFIRTLIQVERGIAIVSEEQGEITGGFIGAVVEHYFGYDLQSMDVALFQLPEHRGGTTGIRLIKEYIKQAKALGTKQVMLANATGIVPERVARLFEAAGFRRLGYVFELEN